MTSLTPDQRTEAYREAANYLELLSTAYHGPLARGIELAAEKLRSIADLLNPSAAEKTPADD